MSAVLYKRSSGTARGARLGLALPPQPAPVPEPDARELEIAGLAAECGDLRRQLRDLERRREDECEAARAGAREEAAREFRQDDARRVEALAAALDTSLAAFEARLVETARELAPRLAQSALARLVQVRAAEPDWLLRVIERRLDRLDAQAVVSLHLAADDASEDVVGQLRARFPAKVAIACDPALKPGTARIGLRLGEVAIDPAAGAAHLLAILDEGLDEGLDAEPADD